MQEPNHALARGRSVPLPDAHIAHGEDAGHVDKVAGVLLDVVAGVRIDLV